MFICCPVCKTRFKFDEQKVSGSGIKLKCSKCSGVFQLATDRAQRSGRLTVLVAHEAPEFCMAVQKVLDHEPFDIISCHDGKEALDLVLKLLPDVVLLNVALPTLYGFQVCEGIKAAPAASAVKIILLAAIYDKTKYKRSPQSLYGADDYIEQHHIPDSLVPMIYRLAANAAVATDSPQPEPAGQDMAVASPAVITPAEADRQEHVRKELQEQQVVTDPDRETLYAAARKLARSIVSDISLYREEELEEGVRTNDIERCLGIELKDGRILFESKMPEHATFPADYYAEALDELIRLKKRELGIDG